MANDQNDEQKLEGLFYCEAKRSARRWDVSLVCDHAELEGRLNVLSLAGWTVRDVFPDFQVEDNFTVVAYRDDEQRFSDDAEEA